MTETPAYPGEPTTGSERVEVRTASGEWIAAVAVSQVEPTHMNGRKVHDFPIVWVEFEGSEGRVPWPVADVRQVGWA